MTALYTKLDNFFNCCNVPLSIIDLNSNFLYERNLNKLSKFTLLNLNIVDKIIKNDLNSPQEIISEHLKIVAIPNLKMQEALITNTDVPNSALKLSFSRLSIFSLRLST